MKMMTLNGCSQQMVVLGYTALGVCVHLHKRQMSALGWENTADVHSDSSALQKPN